MLTLNLKQLQSTLPLQLNERFLLHYFLNAIHSLTQRIIRTNFITYFALVSPALCLECDNGSLLTADSK